MASRILPLLLIRKIFGTSLQRVRWPCRSPSAVHERVCVRPFQSCSLDEQYHYRGGCF
ncbi:hypothetical protein BDQ17DRAFT_1355895 [Cyathus striatus]|nr:hypothetical protein BDQ17DRAFT_1355895 [Cyathus striatus]